MGLSGLRGVIVLGAGVVAYMEARATGPHHGRQFGGYSQRTARCEIDLSPGMETLPLIASTGCETNDLMRNVLLPDHIY